MGSLLQLVLISRIISLAKRFMPEEAENASPPVEFGDTVRGPDHVDGKLEGDAPVLIPTSDKVAEDEAAAEAERLEKEKVAEAKAKASLTEDQAQEAGWPPPAPSA